MLCGALFVRVQIVKVCVAWASLRARKNCSLASGPRCTVHVIQLVEHGLLSHSHTLEMFGMPF